jgi:hypothetical protein
MRGGAAFIRKIMQLDHRIVKKDGSEASRSANLAAEPRRQGERRAARRYLLQDRLEPIDIPSARVPLRLGLLQPPAEVVGRRAGRLHLTRAHAATFQAAARSNDRPFVTAHAQSCPGPL